ncbi:hypothetical protein LguiB_031944 [Lonicera macranthoides]
MDELLPQDLIFNIFSRLEVKQLLQLRSVSKLWCAIIDHPSLPAIHLSTQSQKAQPATTLVLSPNPDGDKVPPTFTTIHLLQESGKVLQPTTQFMNLPFSTTRLNLEGSSNGLLYFVQNGRDRAVVISNPFKKQYRKLPPPDIPCLELAYLSKYGLGFDNITRSLKMVCVFFKELDFSSYKLGAKVNCLGTGLWREINQVPLYPISGSPVFSHGFLHWIKDPLVVDGILEGTIIRFDFNKEEFTLIPCPKFVASDEWCNYFDLFKLIEFKGEVGMVDLSMEGSIEIWVMKDYDNQEWSRQYRFGIRAPRWSNVFGCRTQVLGFLRDEDILLKSKEGYFIYSPNSGLRYMCSVLDGDATVCNIRGSLISIPN